MRVGQADNLLPEDDLLGCLKEGEVQLPPLTIPREEVELLRGVRAMDLGTDLQGLLTVRWGERAFRFGVECQRQWTPKSVAEAANAIRRKVQEAPEAIRRKAPRGKIYPLVLVPYLGEDRLAELEGWGVSGIDLCGNGVVVVPSELLVHRTGFPNRYRRPGAIKNVYRKNSSVVARVFLLVPAFDSVQQSHDEIRQRGGKITLATVSKVCSSLDADLVIERTRDEATGARRLRLLQPDKLLDLLAENYTPPEVKRTFTGKGSLPPDELRRLLASWEGRRGGRVVLTGASSVSAYAVMAREPVESFYCSKITDILKSLGDRVRETDRFPNLTLLEARDDFVYFDRRPDLVASPVQAYLELAAGDKREQETAEQVRRAILKSLPRGSVKG